MAIQRTEQRTEQRQPSSTIVLLSPRPGCQSLRPILRRQPNWPGNPLEGFVQVIQLVRPIGIQELVPWLSPNELAGVGGTNELHKPWKLVGSPEAKRGHSKPMHCLRFGPHVPAQIWWVNDQIHRLLIHICIYQKQAGEQWQFILIGFLS